MIYEIKIKPALNGFIANVGCQTLVFNERETLLRELNDYLNDPEVVEKKYRADAINRYLLNNQPCLANAPETQGPATTQDECTTPTRVRR